jgi:ATP-dependent DNA helicase RecQ
VPDAVTLARKILSAVARLDQRFGAGHVANVLRGRETDLIMARGHAKLSVFGLLKDASVDEVRGYIDQLVGRGLVRPTADEYPVLKLTAAGVELLKRPDAISDLALARQLKPKKDRADRQTRAGTESWDGVDRALFERLRAMRLTVARSRRVPPYVLFHDTTLRELARLKPATLGALQHIYGMGARKTEDLGQVVLDTIRAHEGA